MKRKLPVNFQETGQEQNFNGFLKTESEDFSLRKSVFEEFLHGDSKKTLTMIESDNDTQKNRSPAFMKYLPHCRIVGCNSLGHLNGVDLAHVTVSGCPFYHNMTPEECVKMRSWEEGSTNLKLINKLRELCECEADYSKIFLEAMKSCDMDEDLRIKAGALPRHCINLREPNLEGTAPAVEIYKFRRAQQRMASNASLEVRHHFEITAGTGPERISRINTLIFGEYEIETWYKSNYPEDVACMPSIYVCQFCLTYMTNELAYSRHAKNCLSRFPPGREIYRYDSYSFWEIFGSKQKEYCRNLCLLAKLFLKHKTAHELENMNHFVFYILTVATSVGCELIGYFSKEIYDYQKYARRSSGLYYNLSCILMMPQHMRQGFGKMLIDFSYLLSKLEKQSGTPERPLSDLGLITYRKYWRDVILSYLLTYDEDDISMKELSEETGLHIIDIVSTLLSMGMLTYHRTNYYVVKKQEILRKHYDKKRKTIVDPRKQIHPECLRWKKT